MPSRKSVDPAAASELITGPQRTPKESGARVGKPKGRRGRPPMDPSQRKTPAVYVPTGKPRGRPKLSEDEKAERAAAKAKDREERAAEAKTRGRPARRAAAPKPVEKVKKAAAKAVGGTGKKRGRPSLKAKEEAAKEEAAKEEEPEAAVAEDDQVVGDL
jgi:hypothetical protein